MSENNEQTKDNFDFQGNYQKKYENIKNLVSNFNQNLYVH